MLKIKITYRIEKFDFFLVLLLAALSTLGVLLIGSANPAYRLRQAAGVGMGMAVMVCMSLMDYKRLARLDWLTYFCGVGLLLTVNAAGAISGGAARWIEIGPVRFQPSELEKILFILFFAGLFEWNRQKMGEWRFLLFVAAAAAVPVFLILEQPDLSTSIIMVWIFVCLIFVAGLDYRIIAKILVVVLPVMGILLILVTRPDQQILDDYQYRRIMAWLSPGEWAQDSYQQRNSMMAIGSGGLFGKGLETQTALSVKNGNFLPEPHTDFIMSVAGEELGFAGSVLILTLLLLIVFECIRIGTKAKDMTGKLICVGMAALIGGQSFVNLGVVTGLMPNTGLTLPFLSYGLTSLISLYMGMGLVLNVGLQRGGREQAEGR